MSYKRISPIIVAEGGTGQSTLGSTQILLGNGTSGINSTSNATIDTGTGAINLLSGTGAINIGTDATAKAITVGSTTTSTSLALKVGTGNLVASSATGTLITQKSTGEMTRPLQPCFLYYLATTTGGVTGNNTTYGLGTDALTKLFDQGNNCTTGGTFTAPVTGIYFFAVQLITGSVTVAMTSGQLRIATTANIYFSETNPGIIKDASNNVAMSLTTFANMSSGDTATVNIVYANGVSNAATIIGSSSPIETYFSGYLAC